MALLQTDTAEGALKGMILAHAPHQLGDQEVAYLQDAIVNQPGFVTRRGAITGTTAITAANLDSQRPAAVCQITDPAGVPKVGIFYLKDTGTALELWVSVYTFALGVFTFVQKHFIGGSFTFGTYPNRNLKIALYPSIDGSIIVSVRQAYSRAMFGASAPVAATQWVGRWYGGAPTTSIPSGAAPTATVAATEGSTSVTGAVAEIAKISFPGTVVVNTGVVASVTSTTQVELMYPSPTTYAAAARSYYVGESLPIARARGRISCTLGVLAGVVGFGTKFTECKDRATVTPSSGFEFFDPTTMKLLAGLNTNIIPFVSDTVSGVPTSVTRSASLKNYLMYANSGISDPQYNRFIKFDANAYEPRGAKGSWWATFKGYMISFNAFVGQNGTVAAGDIATTARAYVHGPRFPDIMDHSVEDGDWFDVTATKQGDPDGIAIGSGKNAVVLCKAQETFALRGDDPSDFAISKISDDGALTFESTASWKGMSIWLGRTGIWMYDGGEEAVNITEETLGTRWSDLVAGFDTYGITVDADLYSLNQARCFVYRDHLFVNVTNTASQHVVYTDGVARTSNTMQLVIYLPTLACSFLTNFNFQAFITLGRQGYVIFPQAASTTHHWYPLDNFFTQGVATIDTILTSNSYDSGVVSTSVGPWFHMESRKYNAGDGLRRKVWKQLSIESKLTSTKRLYLETVAGLNVTGVRQVTPYSGTGVYLAFKNKFNARDQYMSFRLYEDILNRPATMSLGAWQWAFKQARKGQV